MVPGRTTPEVLQRFSPTTAPTDWTSIEGTERQRIRESGDTRGHRPPAAVPENHTRLRRSDTIRGNWGHRGHFLAQVEAVLLIDERQSQRADAAAGMRRVTSARTSTTRGAVDERQVTN